MIQPRVHVDIQEYMKKMIDEFPEEIEKAAATPVSEFIV